MSDLSGGAKCVKYTLFVFNILFLLAGLLLIIVGAIVYVKTSSSGFSQSAAAAGILIIVVGSIVFLVSFFGCAGAINNNHCMVVTYGILLLIILLGQIAAVVTGVIKRDSLTKILNQEMLDSQKDYGKDPYTTKSWNETQKNFACCGSYGYRSWNESDVLRETNSVPDSCCKNITDNCGVGKFDQPGDLNAIGCNTAIETVLQNSMLAVIIVAAGVGLLELIGIVFAFCLAHSLRKDYRVV